MILIAILIQGCGGGGSSESASGTPVQDVASVSVVNKNAINPPTLPGITEQLPTAELKNNLKL